MARGSRVVSWVCRLHGRAGPVLRRAPRMVQCSAAATLKCFIFEQVILSFCFALGRTSSLAGHALKTRGSRRTEQGGRHKGDQCLLLACAKVDTSHPGVWREGSWGQVGTKSVNSGQGQACLHLLTKCLYSQSTHWLSICGHPGPGRLAHPFQWPLCTGAYQ